MKNIHYSHNHAYIDRVSILSMEILWLVARALYSKGKVNPQWPKNIKNSRVRKQKLVEIPPCTQPTCVSQRKVINKETCRSES